MVHRHKRLVNDRIFGTQFQIRPNSNLKDLKVKILNEDEFCLSYENKEKFESGLKPFIVHYNELPTRMFHPKNKIGKMRDNNHWLL